MKKSRWYAYQDPTHLRFFSPQKWLGILVRHGFAKVAVFYNGLTDTPYVSHIPKLVQDFVFKIPTQSLSLLGAPLIPVLGETVFFVLKKT